MTMNKKFIIMAQSQLGHAFSLQFCLNFQLFFIIFQEILRFCPNLPPTLFNLFHEGNNCTGKLRLEQLIPWTNIFYHKGTDPRHDSFWVRELKNELKLVMGNWFSITLRSRDQLQHLVRERKAPEINEEESKFHGYSLKSLFYE